MLLTRSLDATITLKSAAEIYAADYHSNVMSVLKKVFQGRCFRSIHILEILELVRVGEFRCKTQVTDGSVEVDVRMRVQGLSFFPGEVLPRSRIISARGAASIYAHAFDKLVSINLKRSSSFPVKENEIVPILVHSVGYSNYNENVLMRGTLLSWDQLPMANPILVKLDESKLESTNRHTGLAPDAMSGLLENSIRLLAELPTKIQQLLAEHPGLQRSAQMLLKGPTSKWTPPPSAIRVSFDELLASSNSDAAFADVLTQATRRFREPVVLLKPAWSPLDPAFYVLPESHADAELAGQGERVNVCHCPLARAHDFLFERQVLMLSNLETLLRLAKDELGAAPDSRAISFREMVLRPLEAALSP